MIDVFFLLVAYLALGVSVETIMAGHKVRIALWPVDLFFIFSRARGQKW